MKYILFVMFMALATVPSSAEAMQARPALPDRVPGDVDANGAANLSDAIVLLRYLFLGDETYRYEIEQEGRGYMNRQDDHIDIIDAAVLINYLFRGWVAPIVTTQVPADTGRVHREIRDGFTFELNGEGYIEIRWPEAFESPRRFRNYTVRLLSPDTGLELELSNVQWTGQRSFRVAVPPRPEFAGTCKVSLVMESLPRQSYNRLPICVPGPLLDLSEISLEEYSVRYSPLLKQNVQDITGTVRLLQDEVHPGGLFRVEGPFDPETEVSYLLVPATYTDSPGNEPPANGQISMGGSLANGALEEMHRNEDPGVERHTMGRVMVFQSPSVVMAGRFFRVYVFCPRNQLPPLLADAGVINVEELPQRCSLVQETRGTVVRRGVRYTDFSNDVSLPQPQTVAPGQTIQINTLSRDLDFDIPHGYLRVVLRDLNAPGIFGETGIRLDRVIVAENGSVLRVLVPDMAQLAGREYSVSILGDSLFCPPWFAFAGTIQVSPLPAGNFEAARNGLMIGATWYRDHSRTTGLDSMVAGLSPGQNWVSIQDTRHSFDLTREAITVRLTDVDRSTIHYSGRFLLAPGDGPLWFQLPFQNSLRGRTVLVEVFVHPHGGGEPVYARAGYLRIQE